MCNDSTRLVAWMDGELAEHEAAEIEQHVQACAECRACIAAYENTSREFAAYYEAATEIALTKAPRKLRRWVPVVAATAAAAVIALLALLPRAATKTPVKATSAPQVATTQPPVEVEPAAKPLPRVHRAHVVAHRKAPATNWAMADPATIQIAIPADAVFPPGVVPEGVTFIANLTVADGSVQGVRLQP